MNTAVMKNWSVTTNANGFLAPEMVQCLLQGEIHNDSSKRFKDGDSIITSAIQQIVDCGTHKVVSTTNTNYEVYPQDVDPRYEVAYPDAYARLQIICKEGSMT